MKFLRSNMYEYTFNANFYSFWWFPSDYENINNYWFVINKYDDQLMITKDKGVVWIKDI